MTVALELKAFDTYPPVTATLSDLSGVINLTTATSVKFIMKGQTTNTVKSGACVITNAAGGIVQYTFSGTDTATPDTYQVEFEIHWAGGGVQTVPSAQGTNPIIQIDADLEGA